MGDQRKDPKKNDNKMRDIKVDKLILQICTGESGDKLTKAAKVLSDLSDQTPCESKAKYSIRTFGIKGNFGLGIDEHIDLGIKYDTSTGIFGMDFYVVLCRTGKRVAKRRAKTNRVGKFQRVTKDDAKLWFIETLGGTILN